MSEPSHASLLRDALLADDTALVLWNLDTGSISLEDASNSVFSETVSSAIANGTFKALEFIHDNNRADALAAIHDVKAALCKGDEQSARSTFSCCFVCNDERPIWCNVRIVGRNEPDGHTLVMVLRNDDEAHRRVEELRDTASRDAMTGVFNKQHTAEQVARHLLENADGAGTLLIFDLDNFKNVNDTYGHLVGDAVLSDMAHCLKTTFRESDVIGRIGGDEFVVFMTGNTDKGIAKGRAEEVRARLRRTFEHTGGSTTVTCSVGMAFAPTDGTTYTKLLEHADAALYHVKEHGRDSQAAYREGMGMSRLVMASVDSDDSPEVTLRERPVEFIFRTLFETRDVKMTADLLLELFGKQFDVQRSFVYYRLPDQSWTCFFDWHDDSVAAPYVAHEGIVTDFINMNYRRTPRGLYSELDDPADTAPEICRVLQDRGIHAFLHAGIMNGDDKFGCVGMDDCVNERVWSDREREVLRAFADILGAFLVQQMNEAGEIDPNAELRDVLECVDRPIFIIEAPRDELVFANARARALFDVPQDLSNKGSLPRDHPGFSVTEKTGREYTCHVLS